MVVSEYIININKTIKNNFLLIFSNAIRDNIVIVKSIRIVIIKSLNKSFNSSRSDILDNISPVVLFLKYRWGSDKIWFNESFIRV